MSSEKCQEYGDLILLRLLLTTIIFLESPPKFPTLFRNVYVRAIRNHRRFVTSRSGLSLLLAPAKSLSAPKRHEMTTAGPVCEFVKKPPAPPSRASSAIDFWWRLLAVRHPDLQKFWNDAPASLQNLLDFWSNEPALSGVGLGISKLVKRLPILAMVYFSGDAGV